MQLLGCGDVRGDDDQPTVAQSYEPPTLFERESKNDCKSVFSAMAQYQRVFYAKLKNKKVRVVVGTVALQIFTLKHKPLHSILITDIPQWATGKTKSDDGKTLQYWSHIYVGVPAPTMVERRFEDKQWDTGVHQRARLQRFELLMTKEDAAAFTSSLHAIAKQIADARNEAERDEIISIASKLTNSRIQESKAAEKLVKDIHHEARDRAGVQNWNLMNPSQKLGRLKEHAGRESVIQRYSPQEVEAQRSSMRASTHDAVKLQQNETRRQGRMNNELQSIRNQALALAEDIHRASDRETCEDICSSGQIMDGCKLTKCSDNSGQYFWTPAVDDTDEVDSAQNELLSLKVTPEAATSL